MFTSPKPCWIGARAQTPQSPCASSPSQPCSAISGVPPASSPAAGAPPAAAGVVALGAGDSGSPAGRPSSAAAPSPGSRRHVSIERLSCSHRDAGPGRRPAEQARQ